MAEKYAECRALGHSWVHRRTRLTPEEQAEMPRPPISAGWMAAIVAYSTCPECTTERIKWIGRGGSQSASRYRYPPDYQRTGENKLTPAQWRQEWIESLEDPVRA